MNKNFKIKEIVIKWVITNQTIILPRIIENILEDYIEKNLIKCKLKNR